MLRRQVVRSILVNTGYLSSARFLTSLARGLYSILLAIVLGPELYGLFSYGLSWYLLFLPLSFWGMSLMMGRMLGSGGSGEGQRLVAQTLGLRLILALATALLALGIAFLVLDDSPALTLVALFSMAMVGRSLAVWANELFAASERSRYEFKVGVTFRLLEVAVGAAALAVGVGIWGIVVIHATSWWLQAVAGLIVVGRRITPVRAEFQPVDMLRLVREGFPLAVISFGQSWLLQGPVVFSKLIQIDQVALGQLALAMQVNFLFSVFIFSFALAALPVISRSVTREDRNDRVFGHWILSLGIFLGTLIAHTGTVAGPWFVERLFPAQYAGTAPLLAPALWLLVPTAAGMALHQRLLAKRRDYPLMGAALVGLMTMALSFKFMVAGFGPSGAIGAAIAGETSWLLILTALSVKEEGIEWIGRLVGSATPVLLSLAVFVSLTDIGAAWAWAGAVVVLSLGFWLSASLQQRKKSW